MHTSKCIASRNLAKITYLKYFLSQFKSAYCQGLHNWRVHSSRYCCTTLLNSKKFYKEILLLIHNYSNSIFLAELHCQRLYSSVEMKVDLNNSLGIGFSNFSCRFLNPNHFFQFKFELFYYIPILDLKNLQEWLKKVVLKFNCLNELFQWSQNFCQFSALSLEFEKFFSIRIFFSHSSRSEQFCKQNTISPHVDS